MPPSRWIFVKTSMSLFTVMGVCSPMTYAATNVIEGYSAKI